MSIYGGFATRHQENTYNAMVKMLIEILATHTLSTLESGINLIQFCKLILIYQIQTKHD